MSCVVGVCASNRLALMRPLRSCPPLSSSRLPPCSSSAQRKGFGGAQTNGSGGDGDDEKRKVKRKRVNIRRDQAPIPNQGMNGNMGDSMAFGGVAQLEQKLVQDKEDEDFAARLAAVKQEGQEKRKEALASTARVGGTSAAGAAFESGGPVDIYANPPSLSATLLNKLNSDVSDPKLKTAQIGPNQVAVAVSAVIFGLVFVLVSGADFAVDRRYQGVQPSVQPPDALQASLIKGRIAQLENARQANPNDLQALEGLAVSYAQLFEFEKASNLLDKLVAAQPNNGEAWRLLGETTLLSQQPSRAAAAYEKAAALNSNDIQVLTGLADAYIANAQQSKAIEFLNKVKQARAAEAEAVAAAAAQAATAESAAPAAAGAESGSDAAVPSTSDSGSTPAASSSGKKKLAAQALPSTVDDASLELLTAKVYSRWRGHDADALATYDALVSKAPEDFRGYLAKGLFLKERGQKSDAERMFLQARFYAPQSRLKFIEQVTGTNPVLDLPEF